MMLILIVLHVWFFTNKMTSESRCGVTSSDMFGQVISVVDTVGAVGTGIRSFPSVDQQVPLQIGLLVGAIGAAWAGIRPVEGREGIVPLRSPHRGWQLR